MYSILKKLIKYILPSKILKSNEIWLRNILSIAYRGKKYKCNICTFEMKMFIILPNSNKLCPKCGSLPRNRRLWQLIEEKLDNKTILHFSPSTPISHNIRKVNTKMYITTDYENEFEADKQYDIQNIDEQDSKFDLIICFHILEHIPNDRKAIRELHRILKQDGQIYFQTPFRKGNIYENNEIKTPEGRLEHFGQQDHQRIYSVEGLISRLEEVGFKVEKLQFEEEKNNYHGFSEKETILIARKI